jgi:predicted metalloprotease with PDZ domain
MTPVEYTIELRDRHAHRFHVEARFPVEDGVAIVELRLPVWTPGSYLVREFERHVQELTADDGEGRALPVVKREKALWAVDAAGAASVRVRYSVYANELTVRTAHLDDTHGFFNPAAVCLYVEALRARGHRVAIVAPDGWRTFTALPLDGGCFTAATYDELVDSPFEIGDDELIELTAQGRPHRIAIWGDVPAPRAQLVEDFTKIIDGAAAVFGDGLPYPDYTFLLLSTPGAYGGLEHARSSTLLTSPFSFAPRKKYEEFLELVSHEFFHLWNVKRIHPTALGPFDYTREAYTRSLWVMEGITSYYDRHILARIGLLPPKRYLEKLGEELGKIANTPGRRRQSLEESSFDAWIKLYRPDENSVNSTISYYLKGGVVALMLDLELRARTRGARSLDDAMRLLWRRYGVRGTGFADDAVQATVEEAAGVALDDFFARYVRGREELELAPLLRTVGLTVEPVGPDEGEPPPVWLGAQLREERGRVIVSAALDDTPAAEDGLYAQDEIVALDDYRVDLESLKERLAVRRPGDRARLTVFRRERLREVTVTVAERPPEKLQIAPAADAGDAEREAFAAWMRQPFPEKAPD